MSTYRRIIIDSNYVYELDAFAVGQRRVIFDSILFEIDIDQKIINEFIIQHGGMFARFISGSNFEFAIVIRFRNLVI